MSRSKSGQPQTPSDVGGAGTEQHRAPAVGEAPEEIPVRFKHVVPAQPGFFAVYYDLGRRALAHRLPVIAWATYERVECDDRGRFVREVVEALVPTGGGGHAEAELAGDLQTEEHGEGTRLLGITFPGDPTDWTREMNVDLAMCAKMDEVMKEVASRSVKSTGERKAPRAVQSKKRTKP